MGGSSTRTGFLIVLCSGRAMLAYCKTPTKEDSGRLRGDGDEIKFINFRLRREQVARFKRRRRRSDIPLMVNSIDCQFLG